MCKSVVEAAQASDQPGVKIVLSRNVEMHFLDWIPFNSRLCPVKMRESVGV